MEIKEVRSKALPPISEKDVKRFWTKVVKKGENECWLWNAGTGRRGYGRFSLNVDYRSNGVCFIATRVSFFISTKIDPIGKAVLHKCDNPGCVNPNHLFLGTNKENTHDMMDKDRGIQPKGSHHGQAILTEADICEIRKRFKEGVRQCQLVKDFSVHQSVISRIVNNKRWKHI